MTRRFAQSDEFYFILANYYINGRQLDLTVLKQDAIIVIELKECADPIRATENGPWLTIPAGQTIGTGKENPFGQAKAYRFSWVDLLKQKHGQFLSPAKAQSLDFFQVSAFVAFSPTLHSQSQNEIPRLPWFRLVGLDNLSEEVAYQTSRGLNFTRTELQTLVAKVLNLTHRETIEKTAPILPPEPKVEQKKPVTQVEELARPHVNSPLSPDKAVQSEDNVDKKKFKIYSLSPDKAVQSGDNGDKKKFKISPLSPDKPVLMLQRGANVALETIAPNLDQVVIGLGWETESGVNFDLDTSAFMVQAQGKVPTDDYFIFYNNLASPDGTVRHLGDNWQDGDCETVQVDLNHVVADIQKIIFTVTIDEATARQQNFGQVKRAYIRLINSANQQELARYNLTETFGAETAMIFGELYRYKEKWKFRAVGQGFEGGLHALTDMFGVEVN